MEIEMRKLFLSLLIAFMVFNTNTNPLQAWGPGWGPVKKPVVSKNEELEKVKEFKTLREAEMLNAPHIVLNKVCITCIGEDEDLADLLCDGTVKVVDLSTDDLEELLRLKKYTI